jgi:hypothetical protein
MAVDLGVEQHRADGEPDRDVGRAFERHVDRPVRHLRGGAGEVDHKGIVLLGDGDDDRQFLLRGIVAVEVAVDRRLGAIDAVGQPGDRLAHQPLGMIHQRVARGLDCVEPVALDQFEEPVGADARRGDLRLHVADHEVGGADIVAHHLPERRVEHALVVDFERLELQALGIGIDRLDDAAQPGDSAPMSRWCAGGGKADQRPWTNTGTMKATSGPWLAPEIGVVVHDDVARPELSPRPASDFQDAADIAGDRARLERRRLA